MRKPEARAAWENSLRRLRGIEIGIGIGSGFGLDLDEMTESRNSITCGTRRGV